MTVESAYAIEELPSPPSDSDLAALATVHRDAVESGAQVSFMAGYGAEESEAYWRRLTEPRGRNVVLVARDAEGIAGTVQLHPAWAPNQPHRADVVKLLVHRRARNRGLGETLMRAIEARARDLGFTLLTLDTKAGDGGHRLYLRLGWTELGEIPNYALDPDGTPTPTAFLYKAL